MLTKRSFNFIYLLMAVLLLGAVAFYILNQHSAGEQPVEEIRLAREALAASREAGAMIYASERFQSAEELYDSAMVIWQRENQKWFPLRNYSQVLSLAESSVALAYAAQQSAVATSKDANLLSAGRLRDLDAKIIRFEKVYSSLPLPESLRNDFSRIKLVTEEIRLARSRQQYKRAIELLDTVQNLLASTETDANSLVIRYFENFESWELLVKTEIEQSKITGKALLVVDKLSGKLMVYKNGKLRHSFAAEFGSNWLGDKLHQGDKATPEGSYFVTRKKERGNTIYYKALLIDYPNKADLIRYQNNVANGTIPRGIGAGNLIEIHGHGGRGYHWTDGCIALEDRDMDVVYAISGVHTPVVVVGSTVPYSEWYQNQLLVEQED